jgi:hypothetical protein
MRNNNRKRGPTKPKPKKLTKGIKIRNAMFRKKMEEIISLLKMQSICPELGISYEKFTKFLSLNSDKIITRSMCCPKYYPINIKNFKTTKDFRITPEQKSLIMKDLEKNMVKYIFNEIEMK